MQYLYLGPEGTFTHLAATEVAPDAQLRPVSSAASALAEVAAGRADRAILPVDNSVNGLVIPTLDALLATAETHLAGSVVLPVSFHAMTVDPDTAPEVIVSHPHALAQCAEFVQSLGLPTRAASSTAAACRELKPGELALAASLCATLYDLHVYRHEVEDNSTAFTQFGIFAKDGSDSSQTTAGGHGQVVVVTPNGDAPGTLKRILEPLTARRLNLANIATRPVPSSPGRFQFLFFVDGDLSPTIHHGLQAEWSSLECSVRFLGRFGSLAAGAQQLVDGVEDGSSPIVPG